jgi:hypothetical protein
VIGCVVFVTLAPQPNVMIAALGAILGMIVSLCVMFLFN